MPELTGTKDLRSYLRMVWRWKWLFLAFLIATPAVAFALDRGKPPEYSATTLVGINVTTVSSNVANTSGSFTTSNILAIAQLVTTTPVADIAAGLLSPPANPGQIAGQTTATGDPTTSFLKITSQDRNPGRAAAVANAFAKAISKDLQQSSIAQINTSIKSLDQQIARLKPSDLGTKTQLRQERDQLIASRSTQGGGAAILQPATASSAALVTTSARRSLELGLLIGLLLGFGAVVLAESADRRIRNPEDLEGLSQLPLLAAIEPSAFSNVPVARNEDEEAFQMLRTALMYFNAERQLESVIITSAGEKEGKTTVASRLAIAAASAGLDVILVDGDLRRAQVSERLGISRREGLGQVIAGNVDHFDALVTYELDEPTQGKLRVLPAGPPPPNPAALMSSEHMQFLLRELESTSDLVIIDTPAALAVSDPVPLMRSVTGIVVIARMNQSTRHEVRRLLQIIEAADGRLLGVVATGVGVGPGYSHYYPKYYAQNGTNGAGRHGLVRRFRGSAKPKVTSAPEE